jgi:hypothetical protein
VIAAENSVNLLREMHDASALALDRLGGPTAEMRFATLYLSEMMMEFASIYGRV